jgi:hypothetical protein
MSQGTRLCTCTKCGEEKPQQKHHFYPQCHFGSGKKNCHTMGLCPECHFKIDYIILAVESYLGDVDFGKRAKLSKHSYDKIHRYWLKDSKTIQLFFS